MTENASEKPCAKNDVSRDGKKARRKKQKEERVDEREAEEEQNQEDANSDGSDFWMPPAGERWDFDNGNNDRWSGPPHNDPESIKSVQLNGHANPAAREDGSNADNGDIEMLDGEHLLSPPFFQDLETPRFRIADILILSILFLLRPKKELSHLRTFC